MPRIRLDEDLDERSRDLDRGWDGARRQDGRGWCHVRHVRPWRCVATAWEVDELRVRVAASWCDSWVCKCAYTSARVDGLAMVQQQASWTLMDESHPFF